MKTFFLGAGLATAFLGILMLDPITIGLALCAMLTTAMMPSNV